MENKIEIDWNDREAVKELLRTEEGAKMYCDAPDFIISLLEKYPQYYEFLSSEMRNNKEIISFMSTKERFYYTVTRIEAKDIDENLVRKLVKYDCIKLAPYEGITAKGRLCSYENKIMSILFNDTELVLPLVKNENPENLAEWQYTLPSSISHNSNLDFGKISLECLRSSLQRLIERKPEWETFGCGLNDESNVYDCPHFERFPKAFRDSKVNLEAQEVVLESLKQHKQKYPDKIEKQGNYWNASCFYAILRIAAYCSSYLELETKCDMEEIREFYFKTISNALKTGYKNFNYIKNDIFSFDSKCNYIKSLEFFSDMYEYSEDIAYEIVKDNINKGENDFVCFMLNKMMLNSDEDKIRLALRNCKDQGNRTEDLNQVIDMMFKNIKQNKSEDNFGF